MMITRRRRVFVIAVGSCVGYALAPGKLANGCGGIACIGSIGGIGAFVGKSA
jgi:hypothetical protein